MNLKTVICGRLEENCHIVFDKTGVAAIVDPGENEAEILAAVKGLRVDYIFITHGHEDHFGGLRDVWEATKASVVVGEGDADRIRHCMPDHALVLTSGGEIFPVGEMEVLVIPAPGHTPGSQCYMVDRELIFTGDTLFATTVGRTDLAGGDRDALMQSISEQLFRLPHELLVYPGHGEATTMAKRVQDFKAGRLILPS